MFASASNSSKTIKDFISPTDMQAYTRARTHTQNYDLVAVYYECSCIKLLAFISSTEFRAKES